MTGVRTVRTMSLGQLKKLTFDEPRYLAMVANAAKAMEFAILANINIDTGEMALEDVTISYGGKSNPTLVGVAGHHDPAGRPVARQLSAAYLHNFGTEDTEAQHFMEAAATEAEAHGLRRKRR